jgi:hypothetical protein
MLLIIYWLHVHIILKHVICFQICVLKICTLWLGLRFEMPIVLRIHSDVHHHLLICVHIILKLVLSIAIRMLRKSLHWLGLWHHHVWLMVINVWLGHSASIIRIQEPNFCHDNCKNLANMRQVNQGAVGLYQKIMKLQWDNCASFYVVMTVIQSMSMT